MRLLPRERKLVKFPGWGGDYCLTCHKVVVNKKRHTRDCARPLYAYEHNGCRCIAKNCPCYCWDGP